MNEDYVVKLPSGDVRVMSHAELDDAFERGIIGERTPVLAPGGSSWTTIARLGGFETDELESVDIDVEEIVDARHHPTSISPVSLEPPSAASFPYHEREEKPTFVIPRRSNAALYFGLSFGALVVLLGVGFGAVKLGGVLGSSAAPMEPAFARESSPPPPAAPIAPVVTATATTPASAEPPTMSVDSLPSAPKAKKTRRGH
jgi:hypothetical protein